MKNLRMGLLILLGCSALPARAQYLGTTSPQTVQATLASSLPCTGSSQVFSTSNTALNALGFRNLGQTLHFASAIVTVTPARFQMEIDGVDNTGNVFRMSDIAQGGSATSIAGAGFYPNIQVQVTCSTGSSFTLNYSGTSGTPYVVEGAILSTKIDKPVFPTAAGSANQSTTFATPFGNSSGLLVFDYISAIGGSTIAVNCLNSSTAAALSSFTFSIPNVTGYQFFTVPPSMCPTVSVVYTSGGAAGNIIVEYLFAPPGAPVNTTLGSYTHITGTTATAVKGTPGSFLGINLNTSGAGTISVFDLAAASCTGTPSTNVVAVLTIAATENARAIPFNDALQNGICVKASAAMDFTVSSQ
jgi:hypothetical protein